MLEAQHLTIEQGTFRLEAHFTVTAGARLAVIGASGAGKSTLLTALAGFLAPVSGQLSWSGTDITQSPPAARPIAMLFQEGNLFPHMSAAENVGLGLRPSLCLTEAERQAVTDALERVGLAGLAHRKPAALSGGQQSRVALARILVQRRPLVLLDEPFAALGPALKTEMLDLVAALCAEMGATLMMITHDPEDAVRLCPETLLVSQGRADRIVETQALLDQPPPDLAAYLGTAKK